MCAVRSPRPLLMFLLCLVPALHAQGNFRFGGTIPVGTPAPSAPVTVTVTRAGAPASIQVLTAGIANLDFTLKPGGTCATGTVYSASSTCTVTVAFTSGFPGERRGAVVLRAADGSTLGMTLLAGTASGPLAVLIPGAIYTVAGNAAWIYAGDGSQANQSSIFLPFGMAIDAAGDLFIADSSNDRIRRVDSTGTISTVAGTGVIGGTGDGGPAVSATLSGPSSVVLDGAGNLYIADSGNNVVRRVDAGTHIITTVAGLIGQHGYTGNGSSATLATLTSPNGLAMDAAGNLYIADTGNNAVRKVSTATGYISTVAGTGTAGVGLDGVPAMSAPLNGPWSVTVAPTGELYIADQNNNRIREIDTSGTIHTVVGNGQQGFSGDGGQGTSAQLNVPSSVVVDVAGNLYVADSGNNRVRKVSVLTGIIQTIAGNDSESFAGDGFSANLASLYGPYTLAIDQSGNLYIADVFHNRIREVAANQASLKYGDIRVGRISPPQVEQLENDGNADLHVASVSNVTNGSVDATTTSCGAGTVVSTGTACAIGASFAPAVTGNYVIGTLNASSDAVNSPGIITMAGKVLNVDPTQINLISSSNPATVGDTVTFSVSVTSPGTTPTGVVTFFDGSGSAAVTLGTATLTPNGTTTFSISTLTGGQHSITASYAGDSSNAAVISGPLLQVIKDIQAATSLSISSAANPIDAGAPLHLTANLTVVHAGAGSGAITGTVTFTEGSTTLGSAVINNGTGVFVISTLAVGNHTIAASYGGSNNYLGSDAAPISQQVHLATSTAGLVSTANPVVGNTGLSLSSTVTTTGGIPGGNVTFYDGSTALGTVALNVHGTATLALSGTALSVGNHNLTAAYAGDAADSPSQSQPLVQVVQQATTTTVVTSSLNPAGQGARITFTAKVTSSAGLATGAVQFLDGGSVIGGGTLDANGTAAMNTAALALGSHAIYAVYAGDPYDAGSTSLSLLQSVVPATTAVTLTSNVNPSVFGTPLILAITVQGTGSIPSGTVTLKDASASIGLAAGTATLDANGSASFSLTNLSIGSHSIVAGYNGDANHGAVDSGVLVERIVQTTVTALSSSTGQTNGGASIRWTAVVQGASNQPVTGPVNFLDGNTVIGQGTLDSTGTTTFAYSALAIGHHTVTAVYAGDAISQTSTSNPVGEVVTLAQTSTMLSTSVNPAFTGTPLTLTVAVTGNGGTPTANVTFYDGSSSLAVLPLSAAGTATLTTSTLSPGTHTLTVSYAGDPLDAPSLSAPVSQSIVQHTAIAMTSSANPSLLTDNVTISVAVTNGVPVVATGAVTLSDGGVTVGTVPLNGAGVATFTLGAPALGAHPLTATYAGDAQNLPGTATLTQNVILRPTVTSLTLSSANLSAGQTVTLVAVVTGTGPHPVTGTVTFTSANLTLGTAPVNSFGVAAITITPAMANYAVVASYASDGLYASSVSAPVPMIVGPTKQFVFAMDPTTLSMKTGDHQTVHITVTTASNFSDTLALGCAGLPPYATCTFSTNQVKIGSGMTSAMSVVIDTGNPLGAGPTALERGRPAFGGAGFGRSGTLLACLLPGGLVLLLGRRKRIASLLMVTLLASLAMVSGCANTFTEKSTPAGNYTFRITGTGNTTGATQSGVETLTVTQ